MLVKNELKRLQKFYAAYFRSKSHFEEVGTQNVLVFQPLYRHFRKIIAVGSGNYIYFWKSIGLSDERLDSITACNYKITPELSHYGSKISVKFNGSCLKQDKVTYNHGAIVNIYIVYEISKIYNSTYPTLENCLFGAVSLTKNAYVDQYKYSRYGIGLDRKNEFSFGNGYGKNVVIFGANMNSSAHVDNKKKDILILGKVPTQGLGSTTLTAEKLYLINFTDKNKKVLFELAL